MLRAILKHAAEFGVARLGLGSLAARVRRAPSLVLAYHNIAPDGAMPGGDRSLHLPRRTFGEQLDVLRKTHEVVTLGDLLDGGNDDGCHPRAAVTFDDAYRGAMTCGLDELERRGLPATVFVAPGLLGGGPFWWDRLADPRTGLADALRRRALEDWAGDGERVMRSAAAAHRTEVEVPEHACPVSEAELRGAASRPGVTLGSHSWSHPNLAALSATELQRELEEPLAWLRARFPETVPFLAYPYGLSSPAVHRAAAAAGYRAAFAVSGGSLRREGDAFALPRLNVPAGMTAAGLAIRACGLRRG